MTFVELDRSFVPIGKDAEPSLDLGRPWGRKVGGWLDWADLAEQRRVVLLAEASSGKSTEFRGQCDKLTAGGRAAFLGRIEELSDQGFLDALDPANAIKFGEWCAGTNEGWFFLDSVDEARLNRKSFETALKRFAHDLGRPIERARVFVSCRVSDWKGQEDRELIERILPAWEQPLVTKANKGVNALLDPIFKKEGNRQDRTSQRPELKPQELLIVQLVPLSTEQSWKLAASFGVEDVDAFIEAIEQNGLDAFTERPGDLIDLADYWRSHARFGSFADMVEHSVNRKLSERDAHRPDNDALSVKRAREGAERLAASLTLGKSFTLRAPGQDLDPRLVSGALDPATVLIDWTPAEQNALLRRGAFAPSTYGRIRFHHRSTQEYLTAQWLDRLLRSNCPREQVWDLIFASRYGVETVVPSLHPTAAWLALRHPDFMGEIIRREPLVLMRHGDPRSIPIEAKKNLLAVYAAKQAAGEISDDSLDRKAMRMFADRRLVDAIRETWTANPRPNFRMDLLRLIREGAISECADLARGVVLDEIAEDYYRIVALQALGECHDNEGLALATQQFIGASHKASARLASAFAKVLYPHHLTTDQLLVLIERRQPAHEDTAEGFPYSIVELYEACTEPHLQREFVTRITDLCFSKPFLENYQRVSREHFALANEIGAIALREMRALLPGDPADYVIRLLMVVERAERGINWDGDESRLDKLVQANVRLQRALFWADVDEQRANCKEENRPTMLWQVSVSTPRLWLLAADDLPWLYEDLARRPEADRRIALNAIVSILKETGRLATEVTGLRERVRDQPVLVEDLERYLAPPREDEDSRGHRRRMEEHARRRVQQEESDKASWVKFSEDLQANPDQLRDPRCLATWKSGAFRLWDLTNWLGHRVQRQDESTPRQWRLLEEGFRSRAIAEAYRDGMKVLWRVTKPERPKRSEGNAITTKRTTILAFGAVGVEAAEDPDWTLHLSDAEAKRAALHGCLSEQGYPEWIDDLVRSHPHIVVPILRNSIKEEWSSTLPGRSDLLNHFARPATSTPSALQKMLLFMAASNEPPDLRKFGTGLRIVARLDLDKTQRRKLVRIAGRRLSEHTQADQDDHALHYLGFLLFVDPDRAVIDLENWLAGDDPTGQQVRSNRTFGFLFDRDDPIIFSALANASVPTLETLLRLGYRYIRPEHDIVHEGVYSPGARDNAERARDMILRALLDRPGPDAYDALRRVAADSEYALRADRFRELARGKAERDAEPPAWSAAEVVRYEQHHTAPVKTGYDLLRVVIAVLSDIQFKLDKGDVSSRPMLQRAKDEDEVQNWIVEQINFRSRDRFTAFREAQVAKGDKPDIIVSSTAAPCEVAIEVKHGGKGWTSRQLDSALRSQLAVDYLKPAIRRHGVLTSKHQTIADLPRGNQLAFLGCRSTNQERQRSH